MMKKHLIPAITALLLISFNADAQWYLFPGKKVKEKEKAKENVVEPEKNKPEVPVAEKESPEIGGWETMPHEDKERTYEFIPVQNIGIAFNLPLNAEGNPNYNFFEMYFGATVAAKMLKEEGINVNLTVRDIISEPYLSAESFDRFNINVGPISLKQLEQALPFCGEDSYIVSPLEPKARSLTDSSRIIQTPVNWTNQINDLVSWLESDCLNKIPLTVIWDRHENNVQGEYLISRIEELGISFERVESISRSTVHEGITAYVIASDRDDFIATSIRELGLAPKGCNPVLYTSSRAKNLPLNEEVLYTLNTRMTINYFVDYKSSKVQDFLVNYRSLINAEPGSFAFQGYDITYYFAKACATYGKDWAKKLEEFRWTGLQSDFNFIKENKKGWNNLAVRRIIYSAAEKSVSLQ